MPLNIVNSEEVFLKGINFHTASKYSEAEQAYRQVLALNPNHPGAHQNLGVLAFQVGRNDAAVPLLKRAIELSPANAAMRCNLGDVYAALRQGDEAIACYRKAIELDPNMATVHNNLGIVYSRMGKVAEAIASWEKAIELSARPSQGGRVLVGHGGGGDPGGNVSEQTLLAAAAYNNLGNAYLQEIRLEKAQECHRKAVDLNPNYANAHSNLLRDYTHIPGLTPEFLLTEHKRWWTQHGKNIVPMKHANAPDPDRKLRLGFISPDLREHSVTHFLLAIFERLDREKFEIAVYSGVNRPDEFTQRLAQCTILWRNALGMVDDTLAKCIHDDKVDILFDLSGHTSDTRLRVFAHHAAPVQISYLGYPMTSGCPVIQWHIVDRISDPEGPADAHYSERLYRLPVTAWCYRPPVNIPAEELPPVVRDPSRPFTFGSFNNCSKISPITFRLWARVLQETPGARMVIKASAMADANTRRVIHEGFAAHGIGADRLDLRPQQLQLADHFGYYANVDLGLDTFPYHGTTTTCEALWMNVPVVTLTGDMHISRVGTSLLTNAGLGALIAASEDEYVKIASGLAKDIPALTALRAGLREKFRKSPVMDDVTFARQFGDALRDMWRQWCAAQKKS